MRSRAGVLIAWVIRGTVAGILLWGMLGSK